MLASPQLEGLPLGRRALSLERLGLRPSGVGVVGLRTALGVGRERAHTVFEFVKEVVFSTARKHNSFIINSKYYLYKHILKYLISSYPFLPPFCVSPL